MNHTKKIIMVTVFAFAASQAHAWSWGGAAEILLSWARTHKKTTAVVLGVFGVAILGGMVAWFGKPRGGAGVPVAPVVVEPQVPVPVVQSVVVQAGRQGGDTTVVQQTGGGVGVVQGEVAVGSSVPIVPVAVRQKVSTEVRNVLGARYFLEIKNDQKNDFIEISYEGLQCFFVLLDMAKKPSTYNVTSETVEGKVAYYFPMEIVLQAARDLAPVEAPVQKTQDLIYFLGWIVKVVDGKFDLDTSKMTQVKMPALNLAKALGAMEQPDKNFYPKHDIWAHLMSINLNRSNDVSLQQGYKDFLSEKGDLWKCRKYLKINVLNAPQGLTFEQAALLRALDLTKAEKKLTNEFLTALFAKDYFKKLLASLPEKECGGIINSIGLKEYYEKFRQE